MANLKSNLEEANAFLSALDPDGVYTFQTFHDVEKRGGGVVLHGTLAEHQGTLTRLNQQGQGVFVMVNKGDGIVHGNAKTCRTAANVVAVRALFADLDGAPLEPVLPYHPHIVVESSPGRWHAYWLTRDLPPADFKPLQQQLAQKFDADPKVCDLPRVMRLPGFWHQKGAPFQARIHELLAKENIALHGLGLYIYAGEDLPQPTGDAANDAGTPGAAGATLSRGQQAQVHKLAMEAGVSLDRVCRYFGVDSLAQIAVTDLPRVIRSLENRRAAA